MSLVTNLARIEQHNQQFDNGSSAYRIGINQFVNLSEPEFTGLFELIDKPVEGFVLDKFLTLFLSNNQKYISCRTFFNKDDFCEKWEGEIETPDQFDWRDYNIVSSVVNQGHGFRN